MTFAQKIVKYIKQTTYTGKPLPQGIRVMDPFHESEQVMDIVKAFYKKYYSDNHPRHLILGINPGRHGSGATGIPFTDPKRLVSECHIPFEGKISHETSSVFIYDMINACGGPEAFYGRFFINSLSPLGFVTVDGLGKEKNYNYYDSKALQEAVSGFILDNIRQLIALGVETDVCFCLGTGKNEQYLRKLNAEHGFFKKIVALEHPRFIMQYKQATKQQYIDKYKAAFKGIL